MSSTSFQKKDISDDAARARKILAKNEPNKVSGIAKRPATLTDAGGQLGPHFVVGITHPTGVEQFTFCRPIGITDLDADKDWVVVPTDQVPGALSRKDDPSEGEINQERAKIRSTLAVTAGLLNEVIQNGTPVYFYPTDKSTSRNTILNEANDLAKEKRKRINEDLVKAKTKEETGLLKQELNQLKDVTGLMKPQHALAERAIRSYWADERVIEAVEQSVPRVHRTLVGPFGTEPQRVVENARGLSLQALIDAVSRSISDIRLPVASQPAKLTVTIPSCAPVPKAPVTTLASALNKILGEEDLPGSSKGNPLDKQEWADDLPGITPKDKKGSSGSFHIPNPFKPSKDGKNESQFKR